MWKHQKKDMNSIYSSNRSWDIRKFSFYTVIYMNFKITTSLAIVQQSLFKFSWSGWHCTRKRQESAMDEATAPWGRCVNVAKWKQLVLTLWMRSNGAVETQWHHKWLRGVFVQVQSTYHCVYTANGCVPWARQQSYCGEVGDLMVQMKMPLLC